MPTEIFNRVTINDRAFAIQKFTAKDGLKIARIVMSKAAPLSAIFAKNEGDEIDEHNMFAAVGAIMDALTDEDIDSLVNKCLSVCYEDLPAGLQVVIDKQGNFCVDDIEYDMQLTIRLCYEAIKWGAADFFDGNSWLSNLFQK